MKTTTLAAGLLGLLCICFLAHGGNAKKRDTNKRNSRDGDQHVHMVSYWSGWEPWSECSRSCGGGVAIQTRECLSRRRGVKMMAGAKQCVGLYKQYKLCNTKLCDSGLDFRAEQCSSHSDRPFMGRLFDWEPFHSAPNPCELHCRADGYRFFAKLADKVIDGTPCSANSTDHICVDGMCKVVGCDGVLGSGLIKDKCGVCGGDDTECDVFSGEYTEANLDIGYHKAFKIPKGAMYINITEMAKSRNYLALQDSSGVTHINGDWRINIPGNYTVGGTVFVYKRDGRAKLGEQFLAMGPTNEDLYLMIIYQTSNPGIHYEYVLQHPDSSEPTARPRVETNRNQGNQQQPTQNQRPSSPQVNQQQPTRNQQPSLPQGNQQQPTQNLRPSSPQVNQQQPTRNQQPPMPQGNQQQPTQNERPSLPQGNQQQPTQNERQSLPQSNRQQPAQNQQPPLPQGNQRQPTTQNQQASVPSSTRDRGQVNLNVGVSSSHSQAQKGAVSVSQPDRSQTSRPENNDRSAGVQTQPFTRTYTSQYYNSQKGQQSNGGGTRISSLGPTSSLTQTQTGTSSYGESASRNPVGPGEGRTYRTGAGRPTETIGSGAGGSGGSGRGSSYNPGGYRLPYGPQRYPFSQGGTESRTIAGRPNPVQNGGGQSPVPTGIQTPGQTGNNNPQGSAYNSRQPIGSRQNPVQTDGRQNPVQTGGRQNPVLTPERGSSTYSQYFRPQYQQTGSGGNPSLGSGTSYGGYQPVPNGPQQGGGLRPRPSNSQYSNEQTQDASTGNPSPGRLPQVLNPYTNIGATLKESTSGKPFNRYQPFSRPDVPGAAGYDNTDPSQQVIPNAPVPEGGTSNVNQGHGNRLFNRLHYMWFETGQTDCSVSCGGGLQQSIVECVQNGVFTVVEEALCDNNLKPVSQPRTCNLDPCPPVWQAGDWGACSRTCGSGRQMRSVSCKQTYSQSLTTTVTSERCDQSTKPTNVQDCKLQSCSAWKAGPWGQCNVQCGEGTKERQVSCVDERSEQLDEEACAGLPKPISSESCEMGACVAKWFASDWSELCSSECAGGERTRGVVCATEGLGDILEDSRCSSDQKPRDAKMCNNMPCGARWFASMWGQCSAECGEGTQTRQVVCVSDTDPHTILPAENCPIGDTLPVTQTCMLKECQAKWFKSDWSECSKMCGGGHRTRNTKCLDEDLAPSSACVSDKPEERQSCNIQPCSLTSLPDENCRDKLSYCPLVAQARLCSYTHYKKSCCFSCYGRNKR